MLYKQDLKYADFTSSASAPATIYKNVLYAAPTGTMGEGDEHTAITIDLDNGETKKYDNGEALSGPTCSTVNNSALYVCRNLNQTSTVGRRDLKTDEVISKDFATEKNICIMTVYATDKYVYCSGTGIEKGDSYTQYLYILDAKTLALKNKVKIPYEAFSFISANDMIYFAMPPEFEEDKGNSYLGIYNEKTGSVKTLEINGAKDFGEIDRMGNTLLLIDSQDEKKKSSVFEYDLKKKKIISKMKVDANISQAQVKGESLFIYSDDEEDSSHIYEYKRTADKFKRIKTYDPYKITGGGITTFFLHQ